MIEVVPVHDWIVVVQGPVPSIFARLRRTPPAAVVPGTVEVAIVEAADAARKGRKPEVIRAVATSGPT